MSSIPDVLSISSNSDSINVQNQWKQRRQDWENLEKAVSSGDIATAKQAFAALQQGMQKVQKGGRGGFNQFEQDMQKLQDALNSGDITVAQQALSTIQQHRVSIGLNSNSVDVRV